MHDDTICAIATASGRGGVGIIRLSGPLALNLAKQTLLFTPQARYAHYCDFRSNNTLIDQGIALYFPGPHSFTGEDVFEFQGHGGPVVLDMMLQHFIKLGARQARPGEFSERAFLNDKIDLTQAEAIADLIDANSKQAAHQALNSLKGKFSEKVNSIFSELTNLRIYTESAIDFPEEEIDFLNDGVIETKLQTIIGSTKQLLREAEQGSIMREGMKVVLAGRPNAGKSTLLNALAQREVAIVTDMAGTTRDVIREHILLDGMPLHIIDTAGIRKADNQVEKIGIERAWQEVRESDQILLLIDASDAAQLEVEKHWPEFFDEKALKNKLTIIFNKSDLLAQTATIAFPDTAHLSLSALSGEGIDRLKQHLREVAGLQQSTEGSFSARRRHLIALEETLDFLQHGQLQLASHQAGELLAEDLRLAQDSLGSITGKLSADELLGKIFSSFCIGK